MFGFFRKEGPFLGLTGMGGGGTALNLVSAGAAKITDASGGTTTDYSDPNGNWKSHTFTTGPATFVINSGTGFVEYLVVGGGGGAGGDQGGGGGAGGYRTNVTGHPLAASPTSHELGPGTYPIVIGSGGAGVAAPGSSNPGNASSFNVPTDTPLNISSAGGGGGGGIGPSKPGKSGGSGGGGGHNTGGPGAGNTPPVSPPQGNDGGTCTQGFNAGYYGGGGGGAGTAGNPTNTTAGNPALGVSSGGAGADDNYIKGGPTVSGVAVSQFCGGGAGRGGSPGGSGAGGTPNPTKNATANSGSGGGAYGNTSGQTAGSGGSGIVIVRYAT